MENLMSAEQIKENLGLKDWRNLTKDKVVDLFNCFAKASPGIMGTDLIIFFNKKDTKYAKIHIHQAKMK